MNLKSSILFCFLVLCFRPAIGQQVLINGDFEIGNPNPVNSGFLSSAIPWEPLIFTPDYLNGNLLSNGWAPQVGGAFEGTAYIGLFASIITADFAEAIGQDISCRPLETGQNYQVSFAGKSSTNSLYEDCGGFQIYGLSSAPIYTNNKEHLSNYPDATLLWTSDPIGATDWNTFSGNFTAPTDFDYLAITLEQPNNCQQYSFIDDLKIAGLLNPNDSCQILTFDSLYYCLGDTISIFGNEVTQSGIFIDTMITNQCCDSIHQISTFFFSDIFTTATQTFTEGDTATIFGMAVTQSGVFQDTFPAFNGCDSIHTIIANFLPDDDPCTPNQFQRRLTLADNTRLSYTQFTNRGNNPIIAYRAGFGADEDFGVTKLKSDGTIEWNWNGTIDYQTQAAGNRFPNEVLEDSEKNVLLLTVKFGTIQKSVLVKLDPDGNFLWSRSFEYFDSNIAYQVLELNNGNYLIAGTSWDSGEDPDIVLVEISKAGDYISDHVLSIPGNNFSFNRVIQGLIQTSDNGLILGGIIRTAGASKLYIIKLDAANNIQWSKIYDGTEYGSLSILEKDSYDGYYLFNNSQFSPGYDNISLTEINLNGDFVRQKIFEPETRIFPNSISKLGNGRLIISYGTIPVGRSFIMTLDQDWDIVKNIGIEQLVGQVPPNKSHKVIGSDVYITGRTPIFGQLLFVKTNTDLITECRLPALDFDEVITTRTLSDFVLNSSENLATIDSSLVTFPDYELLSDFVCGDTAVTILTTEEIFSCEGDSLFIFETWVSENGIYEATFPSIDGCDSTHQITAVFNPNIFTFDTQTYTEGDTVFIFGNTVFENGVYENVFPAANNCDSTHQITVEFIPITPTDCEEELYAEVIGSPGRQVYFRQIVEGNNELLLSFNNAVNRYGLTKLDKNGAVIWMKRYEFDINFRARDILPTNDNGFLIIGTGIERIYLLKIDSDGNEIWTQDINNLNQTRGFKLIQTDDDGFLVIGTASDNDIFVKSGLVVKVDNLGNQEWSKRINYDNGNPNRSMALLAIEKAYNGNYIINATVDFNLAVVEIFPNGEVNWFKVFDKEVFVSTGNSIIRNGRSDGYYVLTSNFNTTLNILEIDLEGEVKQYKELDFPNFQFANYLQLMDNGRLLIGGQMRNTAHNSFITILDNELRQLRGRTFGSNNNDINFNFLGKTFVTLQNRIYLASLGFLNGERGINLIKTDENLSLSCQGPPITFQVENPSLTSTELVTTITNDALISGTFDFTASDLDSEVEEFCREPVSSINTAEIRQFCAGDTAIIFGQPILVAGIFVDTFPNIQGCDSIHQITAIFIDQQFTAETLNFCQGDTAIIFNNQVLTDGIFQETFANSIGCDSTHQITAIFSTPNFTFDSLYFCTGDTALIFNNIVTENGIFQDTFSGTQFCDSIFQITAIFIPSPFTSDTLYFCAGDTANIFNNPVTENGIFTESFLSSSNCDSTHQITAIFQPNTFGSDSLNFCLGDTAIVSGQLFFSDTTIFFTSLNTLGCDSIQAINLSFSPQIFTSNTQTYCSGDTAIVFNQTVTQSEVLSQSFISSNGCDSTHQEEIIFLLENITTDYMELCSGDTAIVLGNLITVNTIVIDSFTAMNGCDSINQLTINFLPTINTNDQQQYCLGDSAFIFGDTIVQDQIVLNTFTGSNGCDSIHSIFVSFADTLFTNEIFNYCAGDSILFAGNIYTSNQILSESFTSVAGCDSIHQSLLIFNPPVNTFDVQNYCPGDTAFIFGQQITSNDTLTQVFSGSFNCDSTHTIILDFGEIYFLQETQNYCIGDTAFLFGSTFTENEVISENFLSSGGCDSIVEINLIFNEQIYTEEIIELCAGDSIDIFGNTISENDVLTQTFPSAVGCDSTHEVTVYFVSEIEIMLYDTICTGEYILFFNDTITQSGIYQYNDINTGTDCDTLYYLTAEVIPTIDINSLPTLEVFAGESFTFPLQTSDPNLNYDWAPPEFLSCADCPNPIGILVANQDFDVTISNKFGCIRSLDVAVLVREKPTIYIPNSFSPNDDGINDRFTIFGNEAIVEIEKMQIFNRWGALIFEAENFPPNDLNFGWDGTYRGKKVNPAVFVYQAFIKTAEDLVEFRKGDLTVIR